MGEKYFGDRNNPTIEGAAKHQASMVGPEMYGRTRQNLEDLACCGDYKAEGIARRALEEQDRIDAAMDDQDESNCY